MSDAIRHVTIRGRVQGVGYRYFVEHAALSRDLEGWVRNRRDGSVEAVFAGPADSRYGHDRGMPARAVIGAGGRAAGRSRQSRHAEPAGGRGAVLGAADDLTAVTRLIRTHEVTE